MPPATDHEEGARRLEPAALALSSLTVLGSQIAVTRILSLKYAANQTFLVVSFAVLGLALGAGAASRWAATGRDTRPLPAAGMALFTLGLALLTAVFYLDLSPTQQILLVPLPFTGVGLALAAVFARRAARAGFYYAVDLGGAALGAFGAAPLLDRVPAPTALLIFVCTGGASALLFASRLRGTARLGAVLVLAVGALLAGVNRFPGPSFRRIPIHFDPIKDLVMLVDEAQRSESDPDRIPFIERSRWSSFGRTDLLNDTRRTGRKIIFVDGAAGAWMPPAVDPTGAQARAMLERSYGPSVVLRTLPPDAKRSALAIGAGGGRDVIACRLGGVSRIVAVELNRDIVELVREDAMYNGGIYADAPDTEIVVEEGRHFLRERGGSWDVILLSIPVTKRGEGYGGFALSESYLFTRESLREYLDHLEPDGQLVVVCHTRQEVGRLVNCYLAAELDRGVEPQAAMERVAVFGGDLLTLVVTPTVRPAAFWRQLDSDARRLGMAHPERLFYYVPGAATASDPFVAVARGADPAIVMARTSTKTFEPDMSPVSDDRPFFYFFTESLPPLIQVVLWTSGLLLLVMMLAGLGGTAAGITKSERLLWRLAVASVGVAFMLFEISLLQRFVFWFASPTLALGLLLGTLLFATGIGSLMAGHWVRGDLGRTWRWIALLGLVVAFAFVPAQRAVFAGASGEFGDAFLRALAITFPIGMVMGVPFPMLLTAAGRRGGVSIAWLWGINGVGSVLGSTAAVGIAMRLGYSSATALGGAAYLLAAAAVFLLARAAGRES